MGYSFLRERERNVLFNDALNTFYLRLYGVRHMVKDHSDSEKGALAGTRNSSMGPPHEGSIRRPTAPLPNALPLSYIPLQSFLKAAGDFYKHHPTGSVVHTTAFDTPVVERWVPGLGIFMQAGQNIRSLVY